MQVYVDSATKKSAVYKGGKVFLREEKVLMTKKDQDGQQ